MTTVNFGSKFVIGGEGLVERPLVANLAAWFSN
jgi:hypothetical protein